MDAVKNFNLLNVNFILDVLDLIPLFATLVSIASCPQDFHIQYSDMLFVLS